MLKETYGEETIGKQTIYDWYARFKEGRTAAVPEPLSGRLALASTEIMKNTLAVLISEDPSLSQCEMVPLLNISKTTVQRILKNDLKWRAFVRSGRHIFSLENNNECVRNCQTMKQHLRHEPDILDRVVTWNELWVYHFDPCSKQESMGYCRTNQPPKKKMRQTKSVDKIMLKAFFDKKGMIYQHIVTSLVLRTKNKRTFVVELSLLY